MKSVAGLTSTESLVENRPEASNLLLSYGLIYLSVRREQKDYAGKKIYEAYLIQLKCTSQTLEFVPNTHSSME